MTRKTSGNHKLKIWIKVNKSLEQYTIGTGQAEWWIWHFATQQVQSHSFIQNILQRRSAYIIGLYRKLIFF